jgi:hypothetical protein
MHRNAIFDQQCLVLPTSARVSLIFFLLAVVGVISDSESNHLRAHGITSRLARRLQSQSPQDEATEDLTWLLTGSNLTTGTTLYKETNHHVAMSKDGSTVAVGSPQYNDTQGLVRVHRWNETTETWYPLGNDILGDLVFVEDNNESLVLIQTLGFSLDLSEDGNVLIAGCKFFGEVELFT